MDTTLYIEHIKTRYASAGTPSDIRDEMIERFNNSFVVTEGQLYIKVAVNGSAHSFIVKKDGPKFKAGDILKAASWAAPAKNFARGNVLNKQWANISWTGA